MESGKANRRGFLQRLAALGAGLAAIPVLATPAQAGRSRWRGGWGGYNRGYGYGGYGGYGGWGRGGWSGRRFYGGVPYYGGGYRGGYGGYYNRGYYGGFGAPVTPFYGNTYYGPVLKLQKSNVLDPLALLEA